MNQYEYSFTSECPNDKSQIIYYTAMKIMLDCSPDKINRYTDKYNYDFWQLRTPLTGYALSGKPYGLDNGCFSRFPETKWKKLLQEAEEILLFLSVCLILWVMQGEHWIYLTYLSP